MKAHPTAAPPMQRLNGKLGYHNHRTMAEVMADEAEAEARRRLMREIRAA